MCIKIKFLILLFCFTMLSTLTYAQEIPCDPDDPTGCATPLDTWIYVLVAIALYFAYRQLQKQKTSLA